MSFVSCYRFKLRHSRIDKVARHQQPCTERALRLLLQLLHACMHSYGSLSLMHSRIVYVPAKSCSRTFKTIVSHTRLSSVRAAAETPALEPNPPLIQANMAANEQWAGCIVVRTASIHTAAVPPSYSAIFLDVERRCSSLGIDSVAMNNNAASEHSCAGLNSTRDLVMTGSHLDLTALRGISKRDAYAAVELDLDCDMM